MCSIRAHGKMNTNSVLPPQAYNMAMDDVMVGFKDEKEKIVSCLIGGLPQWDIVAIVGMPGQGKTTLARNIYDEPFVRHQFQKYAWCCISQEYRIKDILIHIVEQVDPTVDISNRSHEDLAEILYRCLKGKSYLIVLDDIWDIEAWKELKASFPNDENGSRIMLTSRIHKVALEAKPDCSFHDLRPLSIEHSLELLQLKLSYKDGLPPNILHVGKQIAESCKGLPLAIVLIAGLLAKTNCDYALWKQIAESLKSQVAREGCMDVLEVSYKELPDYLRPCFLYLAAFQEDEQILAKKLTQYWIVEGFIRKHEKKSLEDISNDYLMDLVSRSLLFVVKRSSTYRIKKCVVHDLVREFCLEKAKEENFFSVPNISSSYSFVTMHQPYRLCFHRKDWPSFESKHAVPMIRTLLSSEQVRYPYSLFFLKVLRVLDLADIMLTHYDIVGITHLVHLRYLVLRGVFFVPPSIVNLSRLEFLMLISNWSQCDLPRTIWNMKSLRHIYLGGSYFRGMDLVDESIQLDNLVTFLSYRTCSEEELKWQLRRMPNIRKLSVHLNFCIRLSDFLCKIESLNLRVEVNMMSATELDLPSTLKKLTITSYIPSQCVISTIVLSAIGKLPNLEVLKLLDISFEDQTWDVEDEEFLNLKYLKIDGLKIKQWNVSAYSFPQLQQLILKHCHKLTEFPSRFGELLTLKIMKVFQCKKLANSIQEIVAEQHELGNDDLKITTDFLEEA